MSSSPSGQRLRVDSENVVHEEVEGEVIAIDLSGGSYYSLSGSGPIIWATLATGAEESEICTAVAAAYGVDEEQVRGPVGDLLAELREHGLVVPTEDEDGSAPSIPSQDGEFKAPVFERYDDMKDYFLLDPIHEVSPQGWPKAAE